jgi:hypothetical protein
MSSLVKYLKVVDDFVDEWEGVAVLDRNLVEPAIVLDWTEMAILLFDEEEQ